VTESGRKLGLVLKDQEFWGLGEGCLGDKFIARNKQKEREREREWGRVRVRT